MKMEPMPRTPARARSPLHFLGEVVRAFLIVNGLAWIGVFMASPGFRTHGAPSSSKIDARTGKPLMLHLRGADLIEAPASVPVTTTVRRRGA
ncbi:MAG: hypothetical protein HY815_19920 [Candidatus Riflebacteria bacterium]|nr:hypothetical protein [Candidatus Riflebacteria bacterium]